MRAMYNKRRESGMSLAEALVALGLLCVFAVPALSLLRQSAIGYDRAYADYQTDLALISLLHQVKDYAQVNGSSGISLNFSDYTDNGRFEYEIILEEFPAGQTRIWYPDGNALDIQPASITPAGNFSGLITAAVRDGKTGVIKTRALPY